MTPQVRLDAIGNTIKSCIHPSIKSAVYPSLTCLLPGSVSVMCLSRSLCRCVAHTVVVVSGLVEQRKYIEWPSVVYIVTVLPQETHTPAAAHTPQGLILHTDMRHTNTHEARQVGRLCMYVHTTRHTPHPLVVLTD